MPSPAFLRHSSTSADEGESMGPSAKNSTNRRLSTASHGQSRNFRDASNNRNDDDGNDDLTGGNTVQLRAGSPLRRLGMGSSSKRSSVKLSMPGSHGTGLRPYPQPARPTTSPHATHATHAMVLQLQEYHDRLERACASTYQHALQPPPLAADAHDDDGGGENDHDASSARHRSTYCRARILHTNRDCFRARSSRSERLTGAPPPSFSTAVGVKDCVLPRVSDVYVSFHQTTPRTTDFLFSDSPESARRMRMLDSIASSAAAVAGSSSISSSSTTTTPVAVAVAKDHFALGPGQYDVPVEKPRGATKFSPSDRFHENYATDKPGPGQYLANDTLLSPRAAVAVFAQTPRQTDLGALVSPTANVVSSYYYVPESAFDDLMRTAKTHQVGWSRTARFKSRSGSGSSRVVLPTKPSTQQQQLHPNKTTDFITKNRHDLQRAAAQYRLKHAKSTTKRRGDGDEEEEEEDYGPVPPGAFKRRSSLVSTLAKAQGATRATLASAATTTTNRERLDLMLQSWSTIACLMHFQQKLVRLHGLTSLLTRLREMQRHKLLSVTLTSWKKLDRTRQTQYAAHVVVRNALRCRMWLRIKRRRQHANILRQFLSGLSFEVRFSLAMKRIKRKIQLIQRWWRHVQLMVRAREKALYHKWITVETRLRLEYINQMPHLQRIFQPPAGTTAASTGGGGGGGGGGNGGGGSGGGGNLSHASELQLHKLLNLPDQRRWYPGQFVLHSDGSFRGYSLDNNELLVEVKHFRCHYHDVSGSGVDESHSSGSGSGAGHFGSFSLSSAAPLQAELHAYNKYTNATWKPFLMLYRQGAFRFVVVTSLSPLPTEILSWRDKLERLMVNATGASGLSFASGSISMAPGNSFSVAPGGSGSAHPSGSSSDLAFFGSVSDLVEVSMQSGILAPAATDGSNTTHQGHGSHAHRMSASQNIASRGKFQARVRSIRQRNKSGVAVADGTLSYYVVDLLKDFPKVPSAVVWHTIREKMRERRKAFRAEIYRYKLELFHYHQHHEQVKHMHVLEKFRDFFTLERPRRPHFRSLISNRKMESLIRSTVEQVKSSTPPNPRLLLDSTKM